MGLKIAGLLLIILGGPMWSLMSSKVDEGGRREGQTGAAWLALGVREGAVSQR